ncbi:MAG: hypothetical protein AVDCRST_MAG04-2610, partial [uncultured Acetobacteraceae bacterium]
AFVDEGRCPATVVVRLGVLGRPGRGGRLVLDDGQAGRRDGHGGGAGGVPRPPSAAAGTHGGAPPARAGTPPEPGRRPGAGDAADESGLRPELVLRRQPLRRGGPPVERRAGGRRVRRDARRGRAAAHRRATRARRGGVRLGPRRGVGSLRVGRRADRELDRHLDGRGADHARRDARGRTVRGAPRRTGGDGGRLAGSARALGM